MPRVESIAKRKKAKKVPAAETEARSSPKRKRGKQLWILAGGNGAGKSTFYRLYLKPLGMPFVNADVIAREVAPDQPEAASYKASQFGERLRYELLHEGASFCFETVFSHPSKIDFLAHAKALGYHIVLVFIHLNDPALNQARVAQRVASGGHNVPQEKITPRIIRTLNNIKTAMGLCDEVRLLDNSSAEQPFIQIARLNKGKLSWLQKEVPDWASALFEQT